MRFKTKCLTCCFSIIISFLFGCTTLWADVVFIVHPSNDVLSVNRQDIKNIFLGNNVKWDNGTQIDIVILKDFPIHKEFTSVYLQRTPIQFQNWWRRRVFTGKGLLPKEFKTEEALVKYVSTNPKAIGYISPKTSAKDVKVLKISD